MAEFDEYATDYHDALNEGLAVSGESAAFFARGRVNWTNQHLQRHGIRPAAVLDFGCGTGSAIPFLLELNGVERLVGTDVSRATIEVATRHYTDQRVRFTPTAELSQRGIFDVVYCNGVFHHIPPAERASAVRATFDALRPGGLFALWENNPWNPATRYVMRRIPFDRDAITLSPPESTRLLRNAGYEIRAVDFLFIFPRILRMLRPIERYVHKLPLGTQYLVLAQRPAHD